MNLYVNYKQLESIFFDFYSIPANEIIFTNNIGKSFTFNDIKRLLSDTAIDFGADLDDCK